MISSVKTKRLLSDQRCHELARSCQETPCLGLAVRILTDRRLASLCALCAAEGCAGWIFPVLLMSCQRTEDVDYGRTYHCHRAWCTVNRLLQLLRQLCCWVCLTRAHENNSLGTGESVATEISGGLDNGYYDNLHPTFDKTKAP